MLKRRASNLLKTTEQGFELNYNLIFNENPSPALFSRQSVDTITNQFLLFKTNNCQVTNLMISSMAIIGRKALPYFNFESCLDPELVRG